MQPGNQLERLIVMGPSYFRGDFSEAPARFGATSAHAGAISAHAGAISTHAGAISAHAGATSTHPGSASGYAGAGEAERRCHEATYGKGGTSIEIWRLKPVRRLTWDALPVNLPEFVSRSGSSSS
jgi:hypothetical protein